MGFWMMLLLAAVVFPASAQDGPGEIVKASTDRIMALVDAAPSYFDSDPQRYINAIGAELDNVVDFRGFARSVMGQYASSARFRSLDKAGQAKLREQLDAFSQTLRNGLINTYARGLLAFGGSTATVDDTDMSPDSARVASVTQRVQSPEGNTYTIRYQMGQYKDGSWKLRNMIIENINLGEIYRGQFEAAAAAAQGDLDQVIANWDEARVSVASEEGEDGSK
jgi:phospholipid transport system substrate-binding protein